LKRAPLIELLIQINDRRYISATVAFLNADAMPAIVTNNALQLTSILTGTIGDGSASMRALV
jgi:hypothetical protein